MTGAEPFSSEGRGAGVLVLHGFTANPHSMRPLAEALSEAGFGVELPLLPGHGTDIEDMLETTWSDWSRSAEEAFGNLSARCQPLAVVGLSAGGSLTCWLAERHPEIRCIAVVNPMIDPPAQSFRDVVRGILDSGATTVPGIGSDISKPGVAELAYPVTPLKAALSLFEGVDAVAADLSKIACPCLVFTSTQDHVVPPESSETLCRSVSGPVEQVVLEKSFHVATLDYDAEMLIDRVLAFVTAHLGAP
jgi:carboxylesterase